MKTNWLFLLMGLTMPLASLHAQQNGLQQRIILIGDAGELRNGKNAEVQFAKTFLQPGDAHTTVLYLGDNIYPRGLPDSNANTYSEKKRVLDSQAAIVQSTNAQVIFIPGNHDWDRGRKDGAEQLGHQSAYIKSLHQKNIQFLPESGCPGPVLIPLGEETMLIVIDSQWWLQRENRPGATSDCACKTEEELVLAVKELVYRYRDKRLIFASHHPFRSHGPHGGYFTLRQHIFPLTDIDPALFVPLPVLGSIYVFGRKWFGNIQDIKHPVYSKLIRDIDTVLSTHPYCIRVAGHEHALQLIREQQQQYIGSGAGSKHTPVKHARNTVFAAEQQGFAVLDLYQNGETILRFFSSQSARPQDPLYTDTLQRFQAATTFAQPITSTIVQPDSITTTGYQYYRANGFKQWLFGKNYRDEWLTPVKVKVFDIGKEQGGLTPTQRGGGLQSRSLRLEDKDGKAYVLRSVEKYPDKTLPEEFRNTFAKDVVVDAISASYPYAALSVPPLAAAAGVPHAKPQLVYLPDDPRLGPYQKEFANNLYLFEEREPGLKKSYSTAKVLEETAEDNDNRIDQRAVLDARLLDMFLMDFDRHEDQWRWGAKETGKTMTFFPVPRDRDQAFFINTGFIPHLASQPWIMPKFQGFKAKARNINTFNFNARYFDRSFLNALSQQGWKEAIDRLIPKLTDSVIDLALQQQPAAIKQLAAPSIAKTLKQRRQYLPQDALRYYRFLAKAVDITGSDNKELFEVARMSGGNTRITVFKIGKNGIPHDPLYNRVFDHRETKEIRLWGRGGEDSFHITGSDRKPIRLRIIGGGASDIFNNTSNARASRTRIYDNADSSTRITGDGKFLDKTSASSAVNRFDRRSFRYDIFAPAVSIAFNPDDGIYVGAALKYTQHGFRKEPFKTFYQLRVNHSLATNAYNIRLGVQAIDLVGPADLVLNVNSRAPDNTQNFFGFGNETIFDKSEGRKIRYYRSRFNTIDAAAMLRLGQADGLSVMAGPVFQYYTINRATNKGRFISFPNQNGLDSTNLYKTKTFTGAQLNLSYDGRDNIIMPQRGIRWQNTIRFNKALNSYADDFTQLGTDLSLFLPFGPSASIVAAVRIGAGINIGDYSFYQAQYLSGAENLRGFRQFRFAGDKMLYNNIDLRIKLGEFRGYILPAAIGILGFHDIGRVWIDGERSNTWHSGTGGGVWLAPANRYVVAACYGVSKDGGLPFISLGFQF